MKKGYANGSDLIVEVDGKATGHASSHSINMSAESKERAVKPVAANAMTAAMFKDRSVTGMDIQISAEGLRNYDETEGGIKHLMTAFKAGLPVTVRAYDRVETEGTTPEPYLVGRFIITKLDINGPAGDDVTYSIDLQISGAPSVWDPSKISGEDGVTPPAQE